MKIKLTLCNIALILLIFTSCSNGSSKGMSDNSYQNKSFFTMENGELIRPTGYRSWVFVGTPVTPNDLNGGKAPFPEMHNVYIDPASYDHYKKTGIFKEGTILVKELVSVGATSAVSGNGYFEGEFIGLEASVKSKEHFPNEPGNWAIFSFTQPKTGILKERTKQFPYAACAACHDTNADDDFVFTQYYPVLRAAKGAGDINPEDGAKRVAEKKEESKEVGIWDATAPTPTDKKFDIPLKEDKLFAFLNTEAYKKLKYQEKETHKSAGPHETVRSYISTELAESVKAGNKEHPVGSYAIKEQFKDGKQLGWSVMLKTQEKTDNGSGWFWYEVLDRKDISKKAAYGNGVKGCVSCHSIGNDMVRATFLN
ncbi:cytochrome P460 family protein [Tenacibaculum xiamenense]|uniref:cytochrome P460 family protein n=1 Tax=Tenacibaculum xiamenense TaxID=1261553 RepID=UPI0038961459